LVAWFLRYVSRQTDKQTDKQTNIQTLIATLRTPNGENVISYFQKEHEKMSQLTQLYGTFSKTGMSWKYWVSIEIPVPASYTSDVGASFCPGATTE